MMFERSAVLGLAAVAVMTSTSPAFAQDTCSETTEGTALLAEHAGVRAFYDAISTGNPDLVDCAVAAEWTNSPSPPGTPAGPEGFKPGVASMGQIFSRYTFETQDVITADDKVVVRSLVTAQQTGDFMGVPGGGEPVQFQTIDIHQIGPDGKIAQSWHVEDWLTFLLARGALPIGQ